MSQNAQRYSKRRVRQLLAKVVQEMGSRVDRLRGKLIITPRTALKGHVKWTAAIRRAVRPLAEQFGLRAVVEQGKVIYS